MSKTPRKKPEKKKPSPKASTKKEKLEYPYILIEPDRPDIWHKAGFEWQFNLGSKRYFEKFIVNEHGKLEHTTNAPKTSKFKRTKSTILVPKSKINLYTLYNAEMECEFYSASFFDGVIHTQLVPLLQLPDFLEAQRKIDEEEGKFYDLINLRENGRSMWGRGDKYAGDMWSEMARSAEELFERLVEYKRKGALIGEGGSFEYIQVCYIILA